MKDYFKEVNSKKRFKINSNQKVANKKELSELSEKAELIQKSLNFYQSKCANKQFDYVYKEKDKLDVITVKYNDINFPHLTGIDFPNVSASKKLDFLQNGNNSEPALIEKNNRTSKKLEVLSGLPEMLKCNSKILSDLKNAEQAKRIGINKAIKNGKNNLLIGLKDFEPKIYSPKTLLNLKGSHEYDDVPENTILAIFEESKTKVEGKILGVGAQMIDLNRKYVKTPLEAMNIANLVSKSLVQRQQEDKQRKAAQKAAFLRRQRMERE